MKTIKIIIAEFCFRIFLYLTNLRYEEPETVVYYIRKYLPKENVRENDERFIGYSGLFNSRRRKYDYVRKLEEKYLGLDK
jgi:hypothetical protein